jgi:hypothetical protein
MPNFSDVGILKHYGVETMPGIMLVDDDITLKMGLKLKFVIYLIPLILHV